MKKLYPSADAALDGVLRDGMLIASGGFGLWGIPERLLDAIQASGVRNLTFASNNAGIGGEGSASAHQAGRQDDLLLCRREQGVRAPIPFWRARGRVLPTGHSRRAVARRGCRLPGFYTKTGVGTLVAEARR
jgi:3-oxoacid CoA-transferase subunit A